LQPPVVRKKQPPPATSYSISGAAISQVLEKNFLANSEAGACYACQYRVKNKNFCFSLPRKSHILILAKVPETFVILTFSIYIFNFFEQVINLIGKNHFSYNFVLKTLQRAADFRKFG
jgi:hypothetical protein